MFLFEGPHFGPWGLEKPRATRRLGARFPPSSLKPKQKYAQLARILGCFFFKGRVIPDGNYTKGYFVVKVVLYLV